MYVYPDPDLRIVKRCRRSLLFSKEEVWRKKSTRSSFDVNMGSYDSAETIINKNEMGLYRDDESLILRGANGQKADKTR